VAVEVTTAAKVGSSTQNSQCHHLARRRESGCPEPVSLGKHDALSMSTHTRMVAAATVALAEVAGSSD
jgi:hypothetical protein